MPAGAHRPDLLHERAGATACSCDSGDGVPFQGGRLGLPRGHKYDRAAVMGITASAGACDDRESNRMSAARHLSCPMRDLGLRDRAKHRIKISMQALDKQRMHALSCVRDSRCDGRRATRIGLGAPSARDGQEARNAHPAGISGPSYFTYSAFCDGPTRGIGVIITRFRLIGLVFIDRS